MKYSTIYKISALLTAAVAALKLYADWALIGVVLGAIGLTVWAWFEWATQLGFTPAILTFLFAFAVLLSILVNLRSLKRPLKSKPTKDLSDHLLEALAKTKEHSDNTDGRARKGDWGIRVLGSSTAGYIIPLDSNVFDHSIQFEIHNYGSTRVDEVDVYVEAGEVVLSLSKLIRFRELRRIDLIGNRKVRHINGNDKEKFVLVSWSSADKKRYWGNYKNDNPTEMIEYAQYSAKIFVAAANRTAEAFQLTLVTIPDNPPFIAILALEHHIKS